MSALQYNNEEKIILSGIMEEALEGVKREREAYLRSSDLDNKIDSVKYLTKKIQLMEGFIIYCNQREEVA